MRADDARFVDAIHNSDEALVLIDADTVDEARFNQSQLQKFFDKAGRNVMVVAVIASARVIEVIPVHDPLADADD
ncbi:MAG: hypothetical protein AB7E29_08315 [Xanthobacter sp.]